MIVLFRKWLGGHPRQSGEPKNVAPITIDWRDPLARFNEQFSSVEAQLRDACNHVGVGVMAGNVTIWGGKAEGCAGVVLSDHVRLYDGCRLVVDKLHAESGIYFGKWVALNFNCYIEGSGGVEIGDGTIFGPNVVVVSSQHGIEVDTSVREAPRKFGKVKVGHNVWVGANAVIMAGVRIGNGSVIGAGSIVTKDIPDECIAFGAPARVIRNKVPGHV